MPLHEGAPCQTIALCLVPCESEIGLALIVCWLRGMPAVVKDIHICADGLCGDQEGVLRHVARPVDFAFMVDLLADLDFGCSMKHLSCA